MSSRPSFGPPPAPIQVGAFPCIHCHAIVPDQAPGTRHRNHCPACLWSRHVDLVAGDRRSGCGGGMEPIGISVRGDGEWSLLHRCRSCGFIRANRIAGDDDALVLLALAVRPLGRPPFPLEQVVRTVAVGRPASADAAPPPAHPAADADGGPAATEREAKP